MTEPKSRLRPSPLLGEVTAYAPPRASAPIDLHLDGNEGLPPPAELLDAVARAGPEAIRRYPDARPLELEIARSVGVPPERVLVTAGADDALERILRALLAPGREVVLPVPTFGMIARYAALAGGTVVEVPWQDGPLPVSELLDRVTERTAVVTVVSPNSPSGLVATVRDLEELSEGAPDALLLVDLAYTEFADADLTAAALALPNAVVTRSFSKAWGLAGLRVGWAAGSQQVIDWMRVTGHPYAVSTPSLTLALERFRSGQSDVLRFVARVREQRSRLAALLSRLGATSLPSQGNFVLGRFADGPWVRDALAGLGIGVRLFPGKPLLEGCLRITVPGEAGAFARLCHGLETVLAPRSVLVAGSLCAAPRAEFARIADRTSVILLHRGDGALTDLPTGIDSDRCWFVSDHAADLRLARRLGLLPLGWSPGGGEDRRSALVGAGAGRVVSTLAEIEEHLP